MGKLPFILIFILSSILFFSCENTQNKDAEETKLENPPLFELVSPTSSGVTFNNKIQENFKNFFARFNYVYNGGGVAIGDINKDGLPDLYFTGNEVENKLYLNKGNFQFEDITKSAKVDGGNGWHNGVVMADINADGWLDIYICRGGFEDSNAERTNLLFINNGDLTFTESAAIYGLNDTGYGLQAAFFDMENDGDLDMYLTNRPDRFFLDYQKVLEGKRNPNDLNRDKLFRNDNGKFNEIGLSAGITGNYGYGLGLSTTDINKDGFIDIYVSNDYLENDYLYINQGNGTFKEKIKEHTRHVPFYAMGVDVVDFNNDGWEDIIELEMVPADYVRSKTTMAAMNPRLFENLISNGFQHQYMHNMLQLNQGRVNSDNDQVMFSEISQLSGLAKTDWSWACLGNDYDNDGWKDIFITNGFRRDIWDKDANAKFRAFLKSPERRKYSDEETAQHIINMFQPNKIENYFFKNNGDLTFSDQSKQWGISQASFSNGASVGDLDNDGDLDLVVNNIEGEAFIYKNRAEKNGNHFIKIKLEGEKNNPFGLGAKITIRCGDELQYHELKNVRGYLSSVEPLAHFGIGQNTIVNEIKVEWPNKKVSILKDISSDELVSIKIDEAKVEEEKTIKEKVTMLVNVTDSYFAEPAMHQENDYDDYRDQILLPHKLSRTGPCLAVGDVNQDGLEDFFMGGAHDQSGQLYLQTTQKTFEAQKVIAFQKDKIHEDVGAVFFDADGDQDLDLYVVSGGNELGQNPLFYQDRLYLNTNGVFSKSKHLPVIQSSGSCVEPHDIDGDGDLDLFVGGRVSPGKYPYPPSNYLLKNENGIFEKVTTTVAPELEKIGMVTAATWQDLDGDQVAELIIVGEWMPITIFRKENGTFKNVTAQYKLGNTTGWWNAINATDIDKDGDIDFVVGNLGLNYKFHASEEKPFVVFAKDFDRNGTNDVFLAKYNAEELVPVRGKECSAQQLPGLNKKYSSYHDFAKSDIHEMLEGQTKEALKYEVKKFESIWLKNENGQLLPQKLPTSAQFSVLNGIIAEDLNKDGTLDLILAGNKYESEIETTRADASIGVVLIQNEAESWESISAEDSGFFAAKNIKSMKRIQLGTKKETGILLGINDEKLQLWKTGQ